MIADPNSPLKVSRTFLDATDARTPTEEQFPVIKPANLESEAQSEGVGTPYFPSSPPELLIVQSPAKEASCLLPSSPASPSDQKYVDESPLAARQAKRNSRRYGIASAQELQRESTDKFPAEISSVERRKSLKSASTRWPHLDPRPKSSEVAPPPLPKDPKHVTPKKSVSCANLRSANQRSGGASSFPIRRSSLHRIPPRASKFSEEFYSSPPQKPVFGTGMRPGSRQKRMSTNSGPLKSGLGGLLTIDKDADDVLLKRTPVRPSNTRMRSRLPQPSPKSPGMMRNFSRPISEAQSQSQNPAVKFKRSIRNMFTKHREKAPELPTSTKAGVKEPNTKRFSFRSPKKPEPLQRNRVLGDGLPNPNASTSNIGGAITPLSPIPSNPSLCSLLEQIQALAPGSLERTKALLIAQALVTSLQSAAEAKIAAAKAEEFARNAELHATAARISLDHLMGLVKDEGGEEELRVMKQMVRDAGLAVPEKK